MDVFWRRGYNGTTMRDLTEAMGINSSSLYNTIGDKHELFIRSIKHYTEIRMKEAVKQLELIKSPIKAIEKFIQSFNPIDKLLEAHEENKKLYERILEAEKAKVKYLEKLLKDE